MGRRGLRTLDVQADPGQMIKPSEAIEITGIEGLTLQDRRTWNALMANAFGRELGEPDRDFVIELSALRGSHMGNERVEDSIERLMKTIARWRKPDGSISRFQLLGGNNMEDPKRSRGTLTYRFDKELSAILRDSATFGKLEIAVMAAFSSKYALALYEWCARRVNLTGRWNEELTVEAFRDVLGVGKDQLKAFGNLKQRAIVPAVQEVNAWAPFNVEVGVRKVGQRVAGVIVSWRYKSKDHRAKLYEELEKSKIGRKARMSGVTETVVVLRGAESDPSPEKL
jgi:plasmid replication initiation protein